MRNEIASLYSFTCPLGQHAPFTKVKQKSALESILRMRAKGYFRPAWENMERKWKYLVVEGCHFSELDTMATAGFAFSVIGCKRCRHSHATSPDEAASSPGRAFGRYN